MQTATARHAPSMWRDMKRDWQRWSQWERGAAAMLGAGSLAGAAMYVLTLAR